ncbi:prepilin-type N-terminal cleavage/methylation domain-containing protein [Alcanivorax sp. JB21]|uniref:pilus assembly FimT family protein n=1 Tax=Alcanivorax limicola TaxID=2874102 RepID=UPI001CBA9A6B|nr:prepilin-type N-terminal cleavage/methylation domain-containing protein [Alcanivorax limicola]MBZ2190526.1 prepilin-type N-terminal cleavage/methylation domain-containing protein [Alcanivorax limicola]
MNRTQGFTLPELLIGLCLMALLANMALPAMRDLATRQSLIAQSNALTGLLYRARIAGAENGGALVCALGSDCEEFDISTGVLVARAAGTTSHPGPMGETIDSLILPEGMTIQWRSFRNRPWLHYGAHATSYFQNGHFLLCYRGRASRVVVTRIGRPRVDRNPPAPDACL